MLTETTLTRVTLNLGPAESIPLGEGRTFQAAGLAIAVFRTRQGEVFATQAMCPHKGGPLADGLVGAGKVICPLHAYKFELATGRPAGNDCPSLKTYSIHLNEANEMLLTVSAECRDESAESRVLSASHE